MHLQLIGIDEDTFKAATEEERIDWAKKNTTAGFGLCKSAIEWLRKQEALANVLASTIGGLLLLEKGIPDKWCVYRLSSDYQPPVKRWFNVVTNEIRWHENNPWRKCDGIEITIDDATYLQNKPDCECELRVPKNGDEFWTRDVLGSQWNVFNEGGYLRGSVKHRWCKPRKMSRWVAYAVDVRTYKDVQQHCVIDGNGCVVGTLQQSADTLELGRFGGVQFMGQAGPELWSMDWRAWIDDRGDLYTRSDLADCTPAVPIKARFRLEITNDKTAAY